MYGYVYSNESERRENFPIKDVVKNFNDTLGKSIISLPNGFCHMYLTEKSTKAYVIHTVYYYTAPTCRDNVITSREYAGI